MSASAHRFKREVEMRGFVDRIDHSEVFLLVWTRRVLTVLALLVLAVGLWNLIAGTFNFFDSPNVDIEDSFDIPEFVAPKNAQLSNKQEAAAPQQSSDTPDESKWVHPLPRYDDEINEIVDDLYPLYVEHYNFSEDGEKREELIDFIAGQLSELVDELTEDQMDDAVDGLVDYIHELTEFYGDMDLPDLKTADLRKQEIDEILGNPVLEYDNLVTQNFDRFKREVARARLEATENNDSAVVQFMIVGGAVAVVFLLVVFLLVFRVEHSLRRSADSLESSSG